MIQYMNIPEAGADRSRSASQAASQAESQKIEVRIPTDRANSQVSMPAVSNLGGDGVIASLSKFSPRSARRQSRSAAGKARKTSEFGNQLAVNTEPEFTVQGSEAKTRRKKSSARPRKSVEEVENYQFCNPAEKTIYHVQ